MRDPVRFSWDSGNDHQMFLANIGEQQIESIYEVHPGDNLALRNQAGTAGSDPCR
jgi:hypothetical protein